MLSDLFQFIVLQDPLSDIENGLKESRNSWSPGLRVISGPGTDDGGLTCSGWGSGREEDKYEEKGMDLVQNHPALSD